MIAATTSARGTARSPSPPRPDALGFQALFGDELFSLTPADLACYTYAMVNRQDVPYSQVSLEIGRPPLAAEIVFDGTKLAIERSRPKTTTDGRKLLFPALFDQPKNQNRARRSLISFHFGLDTRARAPEFWLNARNSNSKTRKTIRRNHAVLKIGQDWNHRLSHLPRCMSYGDKKWRDWVLTMDEAREHFAAAVESGINFFDTANVYSIGVSEEVTGRWLGEMAKRDEIVVATKVHGPMASGLNRAGLSRKNILEACDASLRRLKMDFIDLYQIHRWDYTTPIEETLEALDSLVRAGKVRYLGASSMAAWQFAKALAIQKENGWHRFVSMQNHYNLVYREEEREMNPLCIDNGVGL